MISILIKIKNVFFKKQERKAKQEKIPSQSKLELDKSLLEQQKERGI